MPRYTLTLTRDIPEYTDVTVEAEDMRAAVLMVEEAATGAIWEPGDDPDLVAVSVRLIHIEPARPVRDFDPACCPCPVCGQ